VIVKLPSMRRFGLTASLISMLCVITVCAAACGGTKTVSRVASTHGAPARTAPGAGPSEGCDANVTPVACEHQRDREEWTGRKVALEQHKAKVRLRVSEGQSLEDARWAVDGEDARELATSGEVTFDQAARLEVTYAEEERNSENCARSSPSHEPECAEWRHEQRKLRARQAREGWQP
jgi:hypothetical protein